MRIIGRLGAAVLGAIGVIIGFVANIVGVFHGHLNDTNTHGVVGMFMVVLGLIATIIVVLAPETAALLFLIAGLAFFYVLGFGGIIVAIFFLAAAVLAYIDRRPASARM
ncbi:MAG TPA: hypothetical protein VF120_04205 [Ktedonobacterales bacterium]